MSDLISVIIPVYNREKYLEECINSVLAQSFQNFEIIVADDGSADSTLEICKRLASADKRIKLISLEHKGVSAARNAAIEASAGEYIFFLDSDDIIHPHLLETLVGAMRAENAAISGSAIVNIPEKIWDKAYELMEKAETEKIEPKSFDTAIYEFFHRITPINLIGGVMMRRDLIGETRFNTEIYIGEDYLFIYENLVKKPRTVFLETKRYYCRIHASNSSLDYGFNGFFTRFERRRLVWESEAAFGRLDFSDTQKREIFGIFMNCACKSGIFSRETAEMRKILKKYKAVLLPAYTAKGELAYISAAYFPLPIFLYRKARIYLLKRFKK